MNRLDEDRTIQWFAPRRPRSTWARTNKERVARLEAAGLMTDAGRAAIAIARANGSWNSLNDIDDLVMPPDLDAALATHEGARAHFDANSVSSRRMAMAWVTQVKSPAIRARRIEQVVDTCVRRERLSRSGSRATEPAPARPGRARQAASRAAEVSSISTPAET